MVGRVSLVDCLKDVDFSTGRPSVAWRLRHEPHGREVSDAVARLQPHFHFPVLECEFVLGLKASGEQQCLVVGVVAVG